jgi:hypothetical protein
VTTDVQINGGAGAFGTGKYQVALNTACGDAFNAGALCDYFQSNSQHPIIQMFPLTDPGPSAGLLNYIAIHGRSAAEGGVYINTVSACKSPYVQCYAQTAQVDMIGNAGAPSTGFGYQAFVTDDPADVANGQVLKAFDANMNLSKTTASSNISLIVGFDYEPLAGYTVATGFFQPPAGNDSVVNHYAFRVQDMKAKNTGNQYGFYCTSQTSATTDCFHTDGGNVNFSSATHEYVSSRAGATAAAAGEVAFDTTNSNFHLYNGVDNLGLMAPASGSFTNNDCWQVVKSGNKISAQDSGAPCGGGTGTFAVSNKSASFTATFSSTPNAYYVTGCTSNVVVTLPGTVPSTGQWILISNQCNNSENFPNIAVAPNGHNIDGYAANYQIPASGSLLIYSDGTNYQISGSHSRNSVQPMTRRVHRQFTANSANTTFDSLGFVLHACGGTQTNVAAASSFPIFIRSTSAASAGTCNGWDENNVKTVFTGFNEYFGLQHITGTGVITNQRIVIGMTSLASSSYSGTTNAFDMPASFSMYFLYSTTSTVDTTHWLYCTGNGGTPTCVSTGVLVANVDGNQFEIQAVDQLATPAVQFFINGILVGISTTTVPAAGNGMQHMVMQSPITGTATNMGLSYGETFSDVH